jgi:hypothetical protein
MTTKPRLVRKLVIEIRRRVSEAGIANEARGPITANPRRKLLQSSDYHYMVHVDRLGVKGKATRACAATSLELKLRRQSCLEVGPGPPGPLPARRPPGEPVALFRLDAREMPALAHSLDRSWRDVGPRAGIAALEAKRLPNGE